MTRAGKPARITTLGGYPDLASIHLGNLDPFPAFFKRKKGQLEMVVSG
jgi:hypothetical protein